MQMMMTSISPLLFISYAPNQTTLFSPSQIITCYRKQITCRNRQSDRQNNKTREVISTWRGRSGNVNGNSVQSGKTTML